jgi:hypothetical protein
MLCLRGVFAGISPVSIVNRTIGQNIVANEEAHCIAFLGPKKAPRRNHVLCDKAKPFQVGFGELKREGSGAFHLLTLLCSVD